MDIPYLNEKTSMISKENLPLLLTNMISLKFVLQATLLAVCHSCFSVFLILVGHSEKREVSLTLKHGVEAKNYEDIGKAEKLKPLEVTNNLSFDKSNCEYVDRTASSRRSL